ncbi:hypothetical protein T4A_5072, partial [Trichinella pseudospiralis]
LHLVLQMAKIRHLTMRFLLNILQLSMINFKKVAFKFSQLMCFELSNRFQHFSHNPAQQQMAIIWIKNCSSFCMRISFHDQNEQNTISFLLQIKHAA